MMQSMMTVHPARLQALNTREPGAGPVLYWMSRDQRVQDNWAMIHAQHEALARKAALAVVFCLAPSFLGATCRQYDFMFRGLREVEAALRRLAVPFFLLTGDPEQEVPRWARACKAGLLVTDFDPLRIKRRWRETVAGAAPMACVEVDAHNVVPCRQASPKLEIGARTLRPKINRALAEFLTGFPRLRAHPVAWPQPVSPVDWDAAAAFVRAGAAVAPVRWSEPGEKAGRKMLQAFLRTRLGSYAESRNDPVLDGQSDLSPYLHFGHISAQRVAFEVRAAAVPEAAKEVFLEELIVRRELSDNFCFHNPAYDSAEGFPAWARATHAAHAGDVRPYLYSPAQFEAAATHDALWNAAQADMVRRGKMHGYLRMYWAKKILEWSRSADEAMATALHLNDRYELDGRDPNGFAGVAWAIGGVHDRPWPNRAVFGNIRCMTDGGCRKKFDVDRYIQHVEERG
jgi:deoxyribodipyrimidine photo-lyase